MIFAMEFCGDHPKSGKNLNDLLSQASPPFQFESGQRPHRTLVIGRGHSLWVRVGVAHALSPGLHLPIVEPERTTRVDASGLA